MVTWPSGVQFGLYSYEWLAKSYDREAGVRFFLITSMITDRIGRQEGQLPINQNNDKIWEKKETRYQLYVFINTKNNSLLGEIGISIHSLFRRRLMSWWYD